LNLQCALASFKEEKWGFAGDVSTLMPIKPNMNGKKRDLGDITIVWMFEFHSRTMALLRKTKLNLKHLRGF
jgi:hypothetical protein